MSYLTAHSVKFYLLSILITSGHVCSTSFLSDDVIISLASKFAKLLGLPEPIPEIVEEANLEATSLIQKFGYPAENHTITTGDGYILTHHRIPHGKNGKLNDSAIPVLLMHGMNCESTQWFDNGPESLAFVLADEGYDVWMGNLRGTSYSSHSTMTHDDDLFWNFNLKELVLYDTLSLIDYTLNKTGFSKLLYIGQSMGTALPFYLMQDYPEYNDKFAGNILLAPVLQLKYSPLLGRPILRFHKQLNFLTDKFGLHSWLSISPLSKKLHTIFCPSGNPIFCEMISALVIGYNPYLRNQTRVPIYESHCSAGSSAKLMIYMGQMLDTEILREFDYGKSENLRTYGSEIPPVLNTNAMVVPTVLIYGANDIMASALDVELGKSRVRNLVDVYLLPHPMTMHTDYMFAKHGKEFLYNKIIDYLKQLRSMSTQ